MRVRSLLGPLVLGCSSAAWLGCVGAGVAPAAEPTKIAAPEPATPAPDGTAEAPNSAHETEQAGDAGAATDGTPSFTHSKPKSDDPDAPREINFVIVPQGLKIGVAGVKFTVSASAAQIGPGWGVKVSVSASAEDGDPHSLSSPKAGPLAFAGSVMRKGSSEAEAFGDQRSGDGEQIIFGDDATKFSRIWPNKGLPGLAVGDSLDLQVALWGLGANTESRRPVKQLCHVRMAVGPQGKPRALIEPPASASGQ